MFWIYVITVFGYILYKSVDKEALRKKIDEIDE